MERKSNEDIKREDLLLLILILGSIWGFSEVVVSGIISSVGIPYRAAILTGVGMCLMGIGVGLFRKPLLLPAIAFITILCKQMVVPILGVSVICKANSCLAVLIEGAMLGAVVAIGGKTIRRGAPHQLMTGFSAGFLSAIPFYFIGLKVAPCQYLLSFNHPGGLLSFLINEALMWGVFSGILFSLGFWVGGRLRITSLSFKTTKPAMYYGFSTMLVVFCWVVSGIFISSH